MNKKYLVIYASGNHHSEVYSYLNEQTILGNICGRHALWHFASGNYLSGDYSYLNELTILGNICGTKLKVLRHEYQNLFLNKSTIGVYMCIWKPKKKK